MNKSLELFVYKQIFNHAGIFLPLLVQALAAQMPASYSATVLQKSDFIH